jgi:hypothetical protein
MQLFAGRPLLFVVGHIKWTESGIASLPDSNLPWRIIHETA